MSTLLSFWLRLTGGEQHCPRGRFALTMLAAYAIYHLLLSRFIHCFITLNLHGMPSGLNNLADAAAILGAILGILMAFVSLLLAFLPLSPVALLGFEDNLFKGYELLQGIASPSSPAPDSLWPSWLGFILGAALLLLAGSAAFTAAWRRLKDAGRSPLFLLLGLTYLMGFGYDGSYAAESAGLYLLGPLWLIILYSQPSQGSQGFELFRTPPARSGQQSPTASAEKQAAPTASDKQGAQQKGNGARSSSSVTSSPPSQGRNQRWAGNRPSPSNDAASYRRRMRERVQAARRRS